MFTWHHQDRKPRTRSLVLLLLAWVFISGQAFLAAGSIYNYQDKDNNGKEKASVTSAVPWQLLSQGAIKMRSVAAQARPQAVGGEAVFLAADAALGIAALLCGLLSWARSGYVGGKLTIAAAITVILVNSILNLPYA